jgi:hypothetical protein
VSIDRAGDDLDVLHAAGIDPDERRAKMLVQLYADVSAAGEKWKAWFSEPDSLTAVTARLLLRGTDEQRRGPNVDRAGLCVLVYAERFNRWERRKRARWTPTTIAALLKHNGQPGARGSLANRLSVLLHRQREFITSESSPRQAETVTPAEYDLELAEALSRNK